MSCGVLGVLPAPAPAEESDGEERGPEEDVGGGEDVEDPHPGQALALNLPADSLHLTRDHRELRRVKLRNCCLIVVIIPSNKETRLPEMAGCSVC